jgi:hypothetical protein
MKLYLLVLAALCTPAALAQSIATVSDLGPVDADGAPSTTSGEFVATGDFNGDGQGDVLLLDKATGQYRLGYDLLVGDGFHFNPFPRASGVSAVSGMSAGHFTAQGVSTFAIASASLNRVELMALGIAATPALGSETVALPAAGPSAIAALDVPSAGNTALPELILATDAGSGAGLYQRHVLRRAAGAWSAAATEARAKRVLRLAPLSVPAVGAITADTAAEQRFELWTAGSAGFNSAAALTGQPLGSRFVSGQFEAGQHDVLLWVQGSGTVRTSRITETSPGVFALGSVGTRSLTRSLQSLQTVTRAGVTLCLMIFTDRTAEVRSYSQAAGFTLVQSFGVLPAPAGTSALAGAAVLPNGDFCLLWNAGPGTPSSMSALYAFNAASGSYEEVITQALPPVRQQHGAGNVMLFDSDVFVNPEARLLRAMRVDDWTQNTYRNGSDVTAQGWVYFSPHQGLDGESYTTMSNVAPAGSVAMGNQAPLESGGDAVSVFFFDTTLGERGDDVSAEPAGGRFDRAVKLVLSAGLPSTVVWYRKGGGQPFTQFPGQDWLTTDTTVEFYGVLANGAMTERKTASFTFDREPQEQDSDEDGVPDFVEIAYGLDPDGQFKTEGSSSDWDGDGFSDLHEILHGNGIGAATGPSPLHASRHPDFLWMPTSAPLRIHVRATGHNAKGEEIAAAAGTQIYVHDLSGELLGSTSTLNWPTYASIELPHVSPEQKLLVVSTQPHFTMDLKDEPITSSDPPLPVPLGREVAGFITVPAEQPPTWSYLHNPALPLSAAANAWVVARRLATGGTRPTVAVTLNHESTLRLLLLEKMLSMVAPMKGVSFNGSLTSFRRSGGEPGFGDPGLSVAASRVLENAGWWFDVAGIRAYRLTSLARAVDDWLATPWPELVRLRDSVEDVYQHSAIRHNANPGQYAPPLEVLRTWIRQSTLAQSYRDLLTDAVLTPNSFLTSLEVSMLPSSFYSQFGSIPYRPVVVLTGVPEGGNLRAAGHLLRKLRTYDGDDYTWPGAFGAASAAQVRVVAFDDVAADHGTVEVIQASIDDFGLAEAPDMDGNLLPDAWELFWFGNAGMDSLASGDNGGYSLLQEYLAGTDPRSSSDHPGGLPVRLQVQELRLETSLADLCVRWAFPAGYGGAFDFEVESSTDLAVFTRQLLEPVEESPGNWCLVLPKPQGRGFYRVVTRLK